MKTRGLEKLTAPIWFRQQGETAPAFDAFKLHRGSFSPDDDMPNNPKDVDSFVKTWRHVKPIRSLTVLSNYISRPFSTVAMWARDYRWNERVFAFDNYIERQAKAELDKQLRRQAIIIRKRRIEESEELMELSRLLRAKAVEMAQSSIYDDEERIIESYPDGRPKTVTIIKRPADWSFRDMANIAKTSAVLFEDAARLILGDELPKAPADDLLSVDPRVAAAAIKAALELESNENGK